MNYQTVRDMIGLRHKSFAFLALLLLVNLSLILYLSLWQQPELEKAQNEWFAKREAAASGADQTVAARYQSGVRDLALFQERLIPKQEFPRFLNELFSAARNDALTLDSVSYKPALIKEEGLISYGITLSVSGKYAAVKAFIADLGRFPELVTLDAVSLANSSQTEEIVQLRVQLTAYLKEGA